MAEQFDVAELDGVIASLTEARREALLHGKCSLTRGQEEWSSDCICAAPAAALAALVNDGLAMRRLRFPHGTIRTPLGLAIRHRLQETTK